MTIKVDLGPEVEAELSRQAAARGRALEVHAAHLLAEAARVTDERPPQHNRPPGRKSLAQLFAESPFKGLDLNFERDADLGRDIGL